jgi:GMP synthase-like glutamine amidotransferase
LLSESNWKVIVKNRQKLIDLQNKHIEFLQDLEDIEKENEVTIEPVPVPVFYKPPSPDYAILCTDPREVWQYHYPALYIPAMIDEDEQWKTYNVFDNEFPTKAELKTLKGIIIPGNVDNAKDDFDYLHKFKEFIKNVWENYPRIKFVGTWFGHQFLSIALEGDIAKSEIEHALTLGKHKSTITNDFRKMQEFKTAFGAKYSEDHIVVLRSHGWYVNTLPKNAEGLAQSEYGDFDIYRIGERVLSMQPHPEFTEKFIEFHILNRIVKNGIISEDYHKQVIENLYDPDVEMQGTEVTIYIILKSEK